MTEQEKEIEKISSDISGIECGKYHDCSSCDMRYYMFCQRVKLAKGLYDLGYRKVVNIEVEK